MTIIKNHFEVFLVTSKKAGKWHYRIKSWVIFNKGQFTHIQGVFEVEVFLLTCDMMRCSKEF
jgi:hypothetical protein